MIPPVQNLEGRFSRTLRLSLCSSLLLRVKLTHHSYASFFLTLSLELELSSSLCLSLSLSRFLSISQVTRTRFRTCTHKRSRAHLLALVILYDTVNLCMSRKLGLELS
jgi:hypothetical protein